MLVLRREIYLFVREKDIAQIGYIRCATRNLHLVDSPDCFELRAGTRGGITFDQNFALRRERQNGRTDRLKQFQAYHTR